MKAKFDDINEQLHREAMTTPDDELLALARKAQKIIPGAWERDSIETDGHYGNGPDVSEGFDEFGIYADGDLLFDSTNTDRAEIEVEYDEDTKQAWNEVSRVIFGYIAAANPAAIIALIERHNAEVERLTRERDEARNAANYAEALTARAINERESAEAAHSAAQKRIAALEAFVREVAHDDGHRDTVHEGNAFRFFSALNQRMCALRDRARAALVSKEDGK